MEHFPSILSDLLLSLSSRYERRGFPSAVQLPLVGQIVMPIGLASGAQVLGEEKQDPEQWRSPLGDCSAPKLRGRRGFTQKLVIVFDLGTKLWLGDFAPGEKQAVEQRVLNNSPKVLTLCLTAWRSPYLTWGGGGRQWMGALWMQQNYSCFSGKKQETSEMNTPWVRANLNPYNLIGQVREQFMPWVFLNQQNQHLIINGFTHQV